jgi:hypothetical protein
MCEVSQILLGGLIGLPLGLLIGQFLVKPWLRRMGWL